MADEPKTLSPTPIKVEGGEEKQVSFKDALELLLLGKKLHKLEWGNKEIYGVMDGTILKLHKEDGQLYQWILSEGDISGTDYVII